ncbi:MAG TPA: HD domain-containing protein [Verrucomicrobiae bacterium]|nr:HD domain-containing protein [Verrucomicrobiae bacterium]
MFRFNPPRDPSEEKRVHFENRIQPFLTPRKFEIVMTAYVFSKYGHEGQFRDGGERYFNHPRAVALILIEELNLIIVEMLVEALLHDVREDAYLLSPHRIFVNFGEKVMIAINLLTKDKNNDQPYLERLVQKGDWQVLCVKCADRLHNLRTLGGCSEEKQRKQVQETREKYPPVLERLEELLPRSKKYVAAYLSEQIFGLCDEYEKSWAA